MIQYSNINDAWGNKEIFKKNILNNNSNIGNPVAIISPKEAESVQDILLAPINNNNTPKVEQNIVVPITANVPLSNTPIKNEKKDKNEKKENNNNNINNPVPIIADIPIISNQPIVKDNFSSCTFAEHLNNCKACRNTIIERFTSSSSAHINILGLEFDISKDVLKVIFIIIIVTIFILLLSLVNIPMKDDLNVQLQKAVQLKYLMNQMNYPNVY
jgi:hypothetical protein